MLGDANSQSPPVLDISHDNHPRRPQDAAPLASHLHPPSALILSIKTRLHSLGLFLYHVMTPSHPVIHIITATPRLC